MATSTPYLDILESINQHEVKADSSLQYVETLEKGVFTLRLTSDKNNIIDEYKVIHLDEQKEACRKRFIISYLKRSL